MSAFRIREARLPDDRNALLGFILGSQHFEHEFEPDRRLDAPVAEEYFAQLSAEVSRRNGKIFVAEANGELLGWGVAHERENEIFVVADERLAGHITELYVIEAWRGKGVGRALIAACETWAKSRRLKTMTIGVLAGNARARRIYEANGFAPYAVELRKYL
ncbi:MAG TPA: GNAT family N-acetyltransferase [Rhizomicrobium sp.]|nr:GNAT family N-acetyltransferase [Rhizomicrobium sp.]